LQLSNRKQNKWKTAKQNEMKESVKKLKEIEEINSKKKHISTERRKKE
jgi:hypothetical protein